MRSSAKVLYIATAFAGSLMRTACSLRAIHANGVSTSLGMTNNSPAILSGSQLLQAMNWRYATKAFDKSRKIDDSMWSALEESLRLSPSSGGLQPWRFTVVMNPEVRAKLRKVSYDQSQITDCSHLVVFARRSELVEEDVDRFVTKTAAVTGADIDKLGGLRDMLMGNVNGKDLAAQKEWTACQVYISLGVLLTSAAVLGVDACPMEGFIRSSYDEILGLRREGFESLCVCALGYRSFDDKLRKKTRYDKDDVFKWI